MSRKRYISTDISLSRKLETLGSLAGEHAVILFTWMMPHLDDWARMEGNCDRVFYQVTPRLAMSGRTPDELNAPLRQCEAWA